MSAEVIRAAALLMRNRAMAADGGPWKWAEQTHNDWVGIQSDYAALGTFADASNAFHAAAMHPGVALAVADWLDACALVEEVAPNRTKANALTVARAYLGTTT